MIFYLSPERIISATLPKKGCAKSGLSLFLIAAFSISCGTETMGTPRSIANLNTREIKTKSVRVKKLVGDIRLKVLIYASL